MPNGAKQAITKQISVCSLILITKEEDQNYNREYSEVINQSLSIKTPCSKELTCSGVVVPFGKKTIKTCAKNNTLIMLPPGF